jgi:N-acetylglucosaminyldiphosphoundecaprenol N-acetyl-beta-D-mannosaminyltransferase
MGAKYLRTSRSRENCYAQRSEELIVQPDFKNELMTGVTDRQVESMSAEQRQTIWMGPARCDDLSKDVLLEEIVQGGEGRARLFFNLNAHALNLILKDPTLTAVFNSSYLTFCDGFGVMLLGRLFGLGQLRHRMTPPDFIEEVYARLVAEGKSVFFLGDREEVVSAYASEIERRFPGLVCHSHHGFFEIMGPENEQVIREINNSGAFFLILGMGMPRQERWAFENIASLKCASVLSAGALFAWGKGRRRGPRWATDRGLEWLFRLLFEPALVWRRYLIGLPLVSVRLALFLARSGKRGG